MPIVSSPAARTVKVPEKSPGAVIFPGEGERRRKQIVDRIILGATMAFCILVVFAVWYSDGKVLAAPTKFLSQFAGKDALSPRTAAMNCGHPKNRNTPYCQDRVSETEGQWQSLSRNQEGKSNPFSLHGPGN